MATLEYKKTPGALSPMPIATGIGSGIVWQLYAYETVNFFGGETRDVRTGIAVAPPAGFRVNLYLDPTIPGGNNFTISNGLQVVHHKYRDELVVSLTNTKGKFGKEDNIINQNDVLCYMEMVPVNPTSGFTLNEVLGDFNQ